MNSRRMRRMGARHNEMFINKLIRDSKCAVIAGLGMTSSYFD